MRGSSPESPAFKTLQQNASERLNPSVKRWIEEGGKVIGLLYNYVPEEILTAAHLLPYRIRATDSTSTILAESRFMEANCSLVRHFYDMAARGGFDFLDGLVSTNSCDHERRLFDNWVVKLGMDYHYFLCFPKKSGIAQVKAYAQRLLEFKTDLENSFDVRIEESDLRAAIDLHNETRRLQRELYDLRKAPNPPLSGTDTLAVMMAGSTMPRQEYNELLGELLSDLSGQENYCEYPLRVFVYGGEIDSLPFFNLIESQGALIVGDSLGYGYRSAVKDVKNSGDALYDLAYNLIMDRPEPRLFGTADTRQDLVREHMQACNASAVIMPCLQMCDYWGFEKHNFALYAKKHDVPTLSLSLEYAFEDSGQIKTRVQAFVETYAKGRGL